MYSISCVHKHSRGSRGVQRGDYLIGDNGAFPYPCNYDTTGGMEDKVDHAGKILIDRLAELSNSFGLQLDRFKSYVDDFLFRFQAFKTFF